jgi:hypothetical protein
MLVALSHMNPVPQPMEPAQQICPEYPHAVHVPLMQLFGSTQG